MHNEQLQAMTVVQLRKLAKEKGVKLSAGIDKSGIVARLLEALGDKPDQSPAQEEHAEPAQEKPIESTQPESPVQADPPADENKLQEAPLSADVTALAPGGSGFRAWNTPQEQGGFRPVRHGRPAAPLRAMPRRRPPGSSRAQAERRTALVRLHGA